MNKIAMVCAGLLLGANGALAADGAGARQFFQRMDTNGDRILEFGEIQAARVRMFDRMDVVGDRRGGIAIEQALSALS